ncbi:S-adenosyl-L-methionine-dependent methyltransferase [Acephala macrosclerotiorum]|nr:S-adenosyl-L-methionine-dependent methyltransferase [Acephala macrosclerotiorum]
MNTMLSSTQSVSSSLYEHVEEHGRTYHRYKEGQYPLPNDETEQNRLDFQHRMFRLFHDNKLAIAPIPKTTKNVLDIATGTGIWATEFADEHPSCKVTGTDLSPIQPDYVPQNCSFVIDDAEDDWIFNHKFDYIHARAVLSCFKNPKAVFQRAFDALEPGGILELYDPIFPFQFLDPPPEGSPLAEWNKLIIEAAAKAGRPWTNAAHYKYWLQGIGFESVVEKKEYCPLSPWAKGKKSKYMSLWLAHNMSIGIEAWSLALFTRVLGWEKSRLDKLLEGVKEDIKNTKIHAYLVSVSVYGKKPGL